MGIPAELAEYPFWTRHFNKRPVAEPGALDKAQKYSEINPEESSLSSGIGILLSPDHQLAIIDIDFPGNKGEKNYLQELAIECDFTDPQNDWALETYKEFLQQNSKLFTQLEGTELLELLSNTYTELSPTGTGLHVFVNVVDKNRTKIAYKKSTNPKFKGQISLSRSFMTVTGIPLYGSPNSITTRSLEDFPKCFAFEKTEKKKDIEEEWLPTLLTQNISKEQVATALNVVSPKPLLRTQVLWVEFTKKAYEHYDFWLTIGMALHDWGTKTNTLATAYKFWSDWSQKDTENYRNEEDLESHWRSFGQQSNYDYPITIATLIALASRLQFSYPVPLVTKNGSHASFPQINEYRNFEYLLNYYKIQLWEDGMYYVSGDEDVMKRFFTTPKTPAPLLNRFYGPYTQKELATFALLLCQDSNWRKMQSAQTLAQAWCTSAVLPLDLVKEWLDTPFNQLPPSMHKAYALFEEFNVEQYNYQSTPEYLFECLNVRAETEEERQRYFSLFKKTLMLLIKFHEPLANNSKFADNGGILVLVGAENTYKSTFLRLLLPDALRSAHKEVNMQLSGEKPTRDFLRQMGQKAIIQVDEFEGFMDLAKRSSQIKNLLSGNEVTFTDLYETSERKMVRKAIIVGTTNETRLALSHNGSRRLWFIPVGKIDTVAATKVNLHYMYNELRKEFRQECAKGVLPWLLTQDEIDALNQRNQGMTASTDLSIVLEELWPAQGHFMPEEYLDGLNIRKYKGPKLMTTLEVQAYIGFKGLNKPGPAALERALERHCGRWTQSLTVEYYRKTALIRKGKLCQNPRGNGSFFYHKWIMPPVDGEEYPEE